MVETLNRYDKFWCFYATRCVFSNWHKAKFTDLDGITYNCSEQYMMYHKAKLFGDAEVMEQILREKDPAKHKEWGRKVKNFDPAVWNAKAMQIVYLGLFYKFSQNREMLQDLLATHGKLLVEAAVNDKVWGVGLDQDDPKIHDRSNWLGTNWLGICLTRLREDFENGDYDI